jgi:F0F1-type ATP synthase membrane subunit b/b'
MKAQAAKTDKERQAAQAELDRIIRQAEAEATKSTLGMREQADRIEQRIMAGGGVDTSQFKVEKVK